MSTNFHVWCETCEEEGPMIRRGAGGTSLSETASHLSDEERRLQGEPWADLIQDRWCRFLIEHAYHELHLFTERLRPHPVPRAPLVHRVEAGDSATSCCGTALLDLPAGDGIVLDDALVTCPGKPDSPRGVAR